MSSSLRSGSPTGKPQPLSKNMIVREYYICIGANRVCDDWIRLEHLNAAVALARKMVNDWAGDVPGLKGDDVRLIPKSVVQTIITKAFKAAKGDVDKTPVHCAGLPEGSIPPGSEDKAASPRKRQEGVKG